VRRGFEVGRSSCDNDSGSKILSVKEQLLHFQYDVMVQLYIPDRAKMTTKPPEKNFFFGLIATLKKEEIEVLITKYFNQKYSTELEEAKIMKIILKEELYNELIYHQFYSRK
jgi:hypothetical protein